MQANNFQDPAMPRVKGNHGNEDTHVAWGSICESQYSASSLDVRRHSKIFCLSKRKKLKNLNFQKRFASAIDIKCSRKGSSILGKKCFGSNVFPFLMEPLEVGCTEGRQNGEDRTSKLIWHYQSVKEINVNRHPVGSGQNICTLSLSCTLFLEQTLKE